MNDSNTSEVARLRQQIDLAYQAAQQGLTGLASGTARHDFITRKMEHVHVCHERLVDLLGADEAIRVLAATTWFAAEPEVSSC